MCHGLAPFPRVSFTYIKRWADLATSDYVGRTKFIAYDAAGRLTDFKHDGPGFATLNYDVRYDAAGRVSSFMASADSSTATAYGYDANDQLVSAEHAYQTDESYTYDDAGNRTNSGYTTGRHNRLTSDGTYAYLYDHNGNRTARFVDNDSDGVLSSGDTLIREYEWDHRNRRGLAW